MNPSRKSFLFFSFFVFFFFSCCVHEKTGNSSIPIDKTVVDQALPQTYSFTSPVSNQAITPGEKIMIKIKNTGTSEKADSIVF
jgi:hypothetical protein